jgi:hypothetical protein
MLAKKAAPGDKKVITRDKEAKIGSIIDATRKLIETMGYEKVTIRDIAEEAGVSVGLIYKYFPDGKFDILVKGFGTMAIDGLLMTGQPEVIDFNDFPGYMRACIMNWQAIMEDNKALIKALTVAALLGGEVADEVKKIDVKDFTGIADFFGRFKGVDLSDKNTVDVLVYWGVAIKGILVFNMIYRMPMSKDALTDLLVDLSLKIWGYRENT